MRLAYEESAMRKLHVENSMKGAHQDCESFTHWDWKPNIALNSISIFTRLEALKIEVDGMKRSTITVLLLSLDSQHDEKHEKLENNKFLHTEGHFIPSLFMLFTAIISLITYSMPYMFYLFLWTASLDGRYKGWNIKTSPLYYFQYFPLERYWRSSPCMMAGSTCFKQLANFIAIAKWIGRILRAGKVLTFYYYLASQTIQPFLASLFFPWIFPFYSALSALLSSLTFNFFPSLNSPSKSQHVPQNFLPLCVGRTVRCCSGYSCSRRPRSAFCSISWRTPPSSWAQE